MNLLHRPLCGSAYWGALIRTETLPWVLDGLDGGGHVLEIGPGPGATTDVLRGCASRLTCVEIDPDLAQRLTRRMARRNVTVLCEDASSMLLPDSTGVAIDVRRRGFRFRAFRRA